MKKRNVSLYHDIYEAMRRLRLVMERRYEKHEMVGYGRDVRNVIG